MSQVLDPALQFETGARGSREAEGNLVVGLQVLRVDGVVLGVLGLEAGVSQLVVFNLQS